MKTLNYTMSVARNLKNVALFLLAPFIGLAYIFAMPVVAVGAIAVVVGKAVLKAVEAPNMTVATIKLR